MGQIHISNPANNMMPGAGKVSLEKGQKNIDGIAGMLLSDVNAEGTMNFKGLLQEKQSPQEMTKEQEQTVALLAAGTQVVPNGILQDAQTIPGGILPVVHTMPNGELQDMRTMSNDELPGMQMTSGGELPNMQAMPNRVTANMQNLQIQIMKPQIMQPQSNDGKFVISENTAEGIVGIQTLKFVQTDRMSVKEAGQNGKAQDVQQGTTVPGVEEDPVRGMMTVEKSSDTQKEMSKGLLQQSEDGIRSQSEPGETESKDIANIPWQEMTMKQQVLSGGKVTQANAHDVMQVDKPQELPGNLAEKIVEKANAGVREFEIQIEPKHLGEIAIKVKYQDGDSVISIICSESRTLEIIKQNVDDISAVIQKNLQEETIILVDEKKAETFYEQQGNDNNDAGRESEWERQREQRKRRMRNSANRFLQELRLGLVD